MAPPEKSKRRLGDLARVNTVFLIALGLRILYPAVAAVAGIELPGYLLVRLLFIVAFILFLVLSFPKLVRAFLWRVRHRLIVTWIFVGVVPIVLICALLAEGMYIFMGQVVSYMTTAEILHHSEAMRNGAYTLAWSLDHRGAAPAKPLMEAFVKETAEAQHSRIGAIVRAGQDVVAIPVEGAVQENPSWLKPGFVGLVRDRSAKDPRYYFGADVAAGDANRGTEVFLYEVPSEDFFKNLLPGVASVLPVEGSARAGGIDIQRERPKTGISFNSPGSDPTPLVELPVPPGRGWWDREIDWLVLMPATDLSTGDAYNAIAVVASRPSLIMKKLFGTLGALAKFAFVLMIFTSAALLVVELISALVGFKLTRSITRAIADLYAGTRKVQEGDFSHRIPVRKTKDQLSELGGSFNVMTERIQDLIVEVKEKERLENELAIAREVQSQLFPKEFPHLKTLELWGGCQPARAVSGDYYDFVSLGSERAALAIGDISGKGISAALLMAHIQSALRSQLVDRIASGDSSRDSNSTSPSVILSILNDHLYKSSPPEKYSTFFLGVYSDETSQLVYTNAGHLAPIIVRRGEVLRLPGEGFPVGLFPGIQYDQQVFGLKPGDVLVAFTDGVTETPNRDGEEFADKRLTEILLRHSEDPLERIATEISTTVDAWAGGLERHDDTTLLLARRLD
jgi:sigma-B regulation protein RsbU (phosphoserine phosphatase)